ncbi:unnamed protein product [Closterium sp. Naga37s-1]|nr:unnamed protein product [Closterium sp. Naga37s-1]CAI5528043.1 unnamed protein product [Closterium sp. Naga37s-1]
MWNSVGFYQVCVLVLRVLLMGFCASPHIAKLGMTPVSCVLEVFFDRTRYSQGSLLSTLHVFRPSQYPLVLPHFVPMQIAKLGMIPVSCVLEVFFDRMRYSQGSRLSVLLVLIGVATCTIADSSLSVKGMVAAAVAVCSTALQQYYVQYLQKKYRLGSFDLLSHTAPVQAGSLVLLGPLIDWLLSGARVDSYDFSVPSVLCIGLSCLIAVAVNASQFICIGRFTALTFQGLGHMKTLSVLVLGYALFGLDGLNAPGLGHMKTLSVLVFGYALFGLYGLNAPVSRFMVHASFEGEDEV